MGAAVAQTGNDAKVDLEKLYEMVLRNSWHLLRPRGAAALFFIVCVLPLLTIAIMITTTC